MFASTLEVSFEVDVDFLLSVVLSEEDDFDVVLLSEFKE
jgi:hypothetical protein